MIGGGEPGKDHVRIYRSWRIRYARIALVTRCVFTVLPQFYLIGHTPFHIFSPILPVNLLFYHIIFISPTTTQIVSLLANCCARPLFNTSRIYAQDYGSEQISSYPLTHTHEQPNCFLPPPSPVLSLAPIVAMRT